MDYQQIDITLVNEPTDKFETDEVDNLWKSFEKIGTFLLPLVLRLENNGRYTIINGNPQYWAATHALASKGKTKIKVNAFVFPCDEIHDTMKQAIEYQMDYFESIQTRPYPQEYVEGLLEKAKAKEEEGLLYEVDLDPEPEAEEEERLELDLDPEAEAEAEEEEERLELDLDPEPDLQRRIELLEKEIEKLWSKVGK